LSDRGARAASRADAAFGMLMSMAAGEIVGGVAKVR
jgi:hypothetical protein